MNPKSAKNLKHLIAPVAAVALVIAVAVWGRSNSSAPGTDSAAAQTPEDCVTRMVMSEKKGDVDAYLDSFTGDLREQLESRMAGQSAERIGSELQNRTRELTGLATTDLEMKGDEQASLVLERLYTGHTESHRVELQRISDSWRIVSLTPLGTSVPEIPYGTPVVPGLDDDTQPNEEPQP